MIFELICTLTFVIVINLIYLNYEKNLEKVSIGRSKVGFKYPSGEKYSKKVRFSFYLSGEIIYLLHLRYDHETIYL